VHGKLVERSDTEVQRRAFEAMAAREEEGAVMHFAIGSTDDEQPEPPSLNVTEIELWVERPDRMREVHRSAHPHGRDGFVGVRDGERWWFYDPRIGARKHEPHHQAEALLELATSLEPA
jgi:hypothetical protein